jgi:signal transduction histidine kinase
VVAAALGLFGSLFATDNAVDVQGRTLRNPARHAFPAPVSLVAQNVGTLLFFGSVVLAIGVLVLRYRRSDREVRLQMKWVVWAGAIGLVEMATELVPGNDVSTYSGPVASGLLTASICIAILRHRLFDIDVVINRTLVFATLTLLVAGLYIAVVAAFGAALGTPTRMGPGLVATAFVAVAFAPARARVQRRVDRLVYGERRNPYQVMTTLGERLQRDDGTEELMVVVQTVTQALKLPYAAIFGPSGEPLAETGDPGAGMTELTLTYQGVAMGQLLVRPREPRGLSRDEQRLLADIARQIGAAVNAVRLSADLQASRRKLVSAKEEERRRLRRDLHDGLGPKLAALGLKLDTAHALADSHPARSKDVLVRVKDDIRHTIDDVRRLVYALRPPALDELGLVEALRECGERFGNGASVPTITVTAPDDLPPLPAAVEVAAYWIVNEALTNVVRHAGATQCEVRLRLSGAARSALELTVCDDGVGLPPAWRAGVGTSSMRERAAELGGSVDVRPRSGGRGTEVHAHVPCEVTGD